MQLLAARAQCLLRFGGGTAARGAVGSLRHASAAAGHSQPRDATGQQQQPWRQWLAELAHPSGAASTSERAQAISVFAITAAAACTQPLTATAAAAAGGPSQGASQLAAGRFEGSTYRGDSLLPSRMYWARKFGMDGGRVTPTLVAVNAGAFAMQCVSPTFTNMCVRVSYKIAAGEYWRLLTPIFVHGNLLHVLVNTFAVWNLGRFAEPRLGSSTLLGVYLGSGVAGNTLSYFMSPGFVVSMGASSSLFGLMGALGMASLQGHLSRAEMGSIGQVLLLNGALMLFLGGSMDMWAHAGGFLGGAAMMALMGPRRPWFY